MAHLSLYEKPYKYQHQHNQMPETYATPSTLARMSNGDKKPRLSRLELMKHNYERKRQKDFEEKLTELRAQEFRTDSGKLHSGGTVRAFFAERRAMEASKRGQEDPSSLPPIEMHFKKMKSGQGPVVPRTSQKVGNKPVNPIENIYTGITHDIHSNGNNTVVIGKYHRKKSKGVDKQNPLPPVQRKSNLCHQKPPTPNRRYETHNTLSLNKEDEAISSNHFDLDPKNCSSNNNNMVYVPQPPKKPKASRPKKRPTKPVQDEHTGEKTEEENDGWSLYSDEPPPNLTKLKALRIKRLSQRKLSVEKPTSFQNWQMLQNEERKERLEKHRKRTENNIDSDEDQQVTLSTRENDLIKKIKAEQEKLSEIKRLQQELEDQEKFERENTISPEIEIRKKTKNETKEEDYYEMYVQTHAKKMQAPVKRAQSVLQEISLKSGHQAENIVTTPPKKGNTKPKPQVIEQFESTEEEEQEKRDNFVEFYEQAGQEAKQVNLDLSSCSICGRNFATERLSKHEVVCRKNTQRKRKKFDVRKQRVSGTEHEKYVLNGKYKEETPKATKANWRVQHENFIKSIRYAKGSSDEPPPLIENPHYVACPYCERRFNPDTADRHIPRCKDIKARPAPPKTDGKRRKR